MPVLTLLADQVYEIFKDNMHQARIAFHNPSHPKVVVSFASHSSQPLPRRFLVWNLARLVDRMDCTSLSTTVWELEWLGETIAK